MLVGSYPTVSPLPCRGTAVCFLWHYPAGHPGLLLATTLPYGVRTFLGDGTNPSTRPPGQLVRRVLHATHDHVPVRLGRPGPITGIQTAVDRLCRHVELPT